jgi:hypothetical protein
VSYLEGKFETELIDKPGGGPVPGSVEATEELTIKAGGELRGGQNTKFTIMYRVITGHPHQALQRRASHSQADV